MSARARQPSAAETELGLQFAALATADADREAAFEAFAAAGLPTRRREDWHYTDLRAALREAAAPAPRPDERRLAAARVALGKLPKLGATRFVLVDGHYVEALSDRAPRGLKPSLLVKSARSSVADPAVWLNDAFAPGGLHFVVDEDQTIEGAIEIVHFTGGEAARAIYSHVSLTLLRGASATFVERFVGADTGSQRNALARISLGDDARVELVTILNDAPSLHVESQEALLGRGAKLSAFALVAGGDLVRRQIFVRHDEPNAKISLAGLSLLDGARHADTTLQIHHAAPHGMSREFYRHVVADEATGVYQGKVIVAQHAQKTDGGMKSQALLLSPTATMNNKPELEIFADDVVCGHGATVGALDPEQLFYLMARGIARSEAEAMLLEAFGAEAIERVEHPDLADALREIATAWLRGRAAR